MNFIHDQLNLMAAQFHWLRPAWLIALVPVFLICISLWRQKRKNYQWKELVAPELLPFLIDGKTVRTKKSLIWILLLTWVIGTIGLAGPSWIKRPTPVEKNQNALVILLDLSYSMISEDVKPSRVARARLKIADILRERKDGQTALVAYAGEAHTVTPISDDTATILSLLSSMSPDIMPLQGSNTEDAVARAIKLLHDAGATQGDLLLVTDGVVPEAFDKIKSLLINQKIQLNILGVGTIHPTPIPSSKGGFLRDDAGAIITTQLNSSELTQLAKGVGGRYHEIATDNSDIDYLKPRASTDDANKPKLERDFDQWIDQGYWLVFLLLPIALFCFRRGLLLSLLLIPLLSLSPSQSYALGLDDMWLTKDQQAQRQLNQGDAKKAAEQFESPEWKAAAEYRAGNYAAAAQDYSKIDSASGHYNRGNALAKAGKLEDAIKAYDEALKRDDNLDDAKKNRLLAEQLLKQQKDQKKNDAENNKDKNKDENKKDNKDNANDKKDEQNQDKQNQSDQDKPDQNQQDKQDSKDQDKKNQKDLQQNNSQSSNGSENQDQSQAGKQQSSQSASADQPAQSGQSSSAASAQQQADTAQASSTGSSAGAQSQHLEVNQDNLTDEQRQALEQWLRRVPDDPGGLLRNKFRYQYQLNRQKQADGELKSPANNADHRL